MVPKKGQAALVARVEAPHACICGAAGAPCPHCNGADDEPLRLPKDLEPDA